MAHERAYKGLTVVAQKISKKPNESLENPRERALLVVSNDLRECSGSLDSH